jgi:hypothetical protein
MSFSPNASPWCASFGLWAVLLCWWILILWALALHWQRRRGKKAAGPRQE